MFASLQHGTATTLHTAQQALAKRSREKRHAGDGALCTGVSGAAVGHRRRGWQPAVCRRQERCAVPAAGGSAGLGRHRGAWGRSCGGGTGCSGTAARSRRGARSLLRLSCASAAPQLLRWEQNPKSVEYLGPHPLKWHFTSNSV